MFNYSLNNPQVSSHLEGFEQQRSAISRSSMVPVDYTNLRGGTYRYVMQLMDTMRRGNKEVTIRMASIRRHLAGELSTVSEAQEKQDMVDASDLDLQSLGALVVGR